MQGFALRDGQTKLVRQRVAGSLLTELYDLASDPEERAPLPAGSERERALLERLEVQMKAPRLDAETFPIDDATRAQLRSLGYAE